MRMTTGAALAPPPGTLFVVACLQRAGCSVHGSTARATAIKLLVDNWEVRDSTLLALLSELCRDPAAPAVRLATAVGLPSRFVLSRFLTHNLLPTLTDLRRCLRVLEWVHTSETERLPLSVQALRQGVDPAPWYRTVKEVTGQNWSEIKRRPAAAVAIHLRARFQGGSMT